MGGKCGICGDAWDDDPREHEAPDGKFANGIIVRTYRPGADVEVTIEVTANHVGYFQFKLGVNNNTALDPTQECFDNGHTLRVLPDLFDRYKLLSSEKGTYQFKIRLPDDVYCSQCIIQWTYVTGNSWGICADGSQEIGCGDQEHFRACVDIGIAGEPIERPVSTEGPLQPTTTAATTTEGGNGGGEESTTTATGGGGNLGQRECQATGVYANVAGITEWCNVNCNVAESDCPADMCKCTCNDCP